MGTKPDHGPKAISVNGEVSTAIYKHLDSSRQEIRLLILHSSAKKEEEIKCTLSHTTLKSPTNVKGPAYEALSYVWGEPDFSEPIILNDHTFYITPSLKYILSCLRRKDENRVLWVDAICINQSDIEERGHQVALMREIYSNCQRDIAWLDPMIGKNVKSRDIYENPDFAGEEIRVKNGMDLMREIAEKNPQTLKQLQDRFRDSGYEILTSSQYLIGAVFNEPTLWERLWVMQELSLAPSLTLMSKDAELSWDVLTNLFKDEPYIDAFHMARSHGDNYYKDFSEAFVPIKQIEDQRRLMAPGKGSSLMDVLVRFRGKESTNPRDKVFGLLGLVTEDHGINVDYLMSVRELYQKTTVSLINLAGNLDILCQNPFERLKGPSALWRVDWEGEGEGDGDEDDCRLPSWVAEFDSKHWQCVPILFAHRGIFNAGLKHCEPCRPAGPKGDILVAKGTILGSVGPVLEYGQDSGGAFGIMNLYLGKDVLENPENHMYAPKVGGKQISTSETAIRAFWRTLVRDCTLPPRMRRLRETEIEALDVENQEILREGMSNIQTYRLHFGNRYSRSAFTYNPVLDEDLTELDKEGQISNHYSSVGFTFAMTDNGLFLSTRFAAQKGDVVVVLDGGKVPMVLRKINSEYSLDNGGELYRVVGSTYVHGFMDGEAEVGVTEGWLEKREILIA
ncbi:heterokaryon incompatibility 6 OR allele [Fusarium beomiforme]|uniref:Heterokaryon incompatibility 6 OR allele n=1 Tax=Fusarium beomiforme TaxID=44412 RepID=A0A9P5E4E1_9HYPO|nr:heterokaryon incompatibility 6 OR allele [Fusarium beomiforme]